MIWDVPWTFNVPPKADDTDKDKPSTHKCVDKNYNYDLSMASSPNMEANKGLGIESCLVGIKK